MAEYTPPESSSAKTERNELLLYILNNASTKLPLKQTDMAEIFRKQNKILQQHLPEVKDVLKNVYGIILKEVPNPKPGVKKYICYAHDNIHTSEILHEEQKQEITLLFIILSYIFMMGGTVYEEQLQGFLATLSIFYQEEHSYFGKNLKTLILETFVKQLYLKRDKSASDLDVDVRYVLSWGYRAQMEFKKKDILKAAAKLLGRSPEFFLTQYLKASLEDKKDDEDDDEDDDDDDDKDDDDDDVTILDE